MSVNLVLLWCGLYDAIFGNIFAHYFPPMTLSPCCAQKKRASGINWGSALKMTALYIQCPLQFYWSGMCSEWGGILQGREASWAKHWLRGISFCLSLFLPQGHSMMLKSIFSQAIPELCVPCVPVPNLRLYSLVGNNTEPWKQQSSQH